MVLLYSLAALVFVLLSAYGGVCTYHRWWRSETGFVIFEPLPGIYFGLVLVFLFSFSVAAFSRLDGPLFMLELALFPFGVLGSVMFGFGYALETGARMIAPSGGKVVRTFDRGDGFMAQNKFVEAEREFRQALQEEPDNIEALLRLSRALEGQNEFELAAQELSVTHRHLVIRRNDPAPASENWQPKLLAITYALGDVYATKLKDPERAQRIYKSTLELLFGYPDADPLRERLKRLERSSAPPPPPADAIPERLSLED